MIDPTYEDHMDNKASHCAKMLNDYYQKYNAQKGTQFVFSDLGTYKPGGGMSIRKSNVSSLKTMAYPHQRSVSFKNAKMRRLKKQ